MKKYKTPFIGGYFICHPELDSGFSTLLNRFHLNFQCKRFSSKWVLSRISNNHELIIKDFFYGDRLIIPLYGCTGGNSLWMKPSVHARIIRPSYLRSSYDLFNIFTTVGNRFMEKYGFFISSFHTEKFHIKCWDFFSFSYVKSNS